jgi:hypothetical protein
VTRQGRLGTGVVQVRLTGLPADAGTLAGVLASVPAVRILTGPDGPYPNRRPPGHRLYLTVQLTQPPPKPELPEEKEPPMTTEPTYDPSNVHMAQGRTHGSIQFLDPGQPEADAADPDAPIPYTLTPEAAGYLDGFSAGLGPAAPEPEAEL